MKFYQQLSQVDVDGTIALSERHVHTASIEGTCSAADINGPPRAHPHFLNALKRVDLLDGSQRHVGKIRRSKLLAPTNIIGFGLRRVQDFFQGEQVDSDVPSSATDDVYRAKLQLHLYEHMFYTNVGRVMENVMQAVVYGGGE